MAVYMLTDKQKSLLRSIAPGLTDGSVKPELTLITDSTGIIFVVGLDDSGQLWREVWNGVTHTDFEVLERNGFLYCTGYDNYGSKNRFALDEARILDAVENDFKIPDPVPSPVHVVSHGGIVNIQSTFQNSHQMIHNAAQLEDKFKAELNDLMKQLNAALAQVPEEYADEVEAVTIEAGRLAEDISRDRPNKWSITITAEGLRKAAENLAGIAGPVTSIVSSIIGLVLKSIK